MAKQLKNKPLVEAILEIRWALQGQPPGPQTDPHYKLLLGRLFDRVISEYPTHEQLLTASIPDELVGHTVQHRFRVSDNGWPLIQLGPGIFSVNSTVDYTWTDFCSRVLSAVSKLFEAHPKQSDLKITNLILRYIDAVDFDFLSNNTFEFLRDKLKVNVSLPPNLFEGTAVENRPSSFTLQNSFACTKPKGIVNVRFATGHKDNAPAVIWDTTVESADTDIPNMPSDFETWINEAHTITDDWFFKLIEGDLERRFSGE